MEGPSAVLKSLFQEIWLFERYKLPGYEIGPSDVVVDVGANIGLFALYAASRAPGVRVVSYEPEPRNFAVLSRNIAGSPRLCEQVRPHNKAVAGKPGDITLYVDERHPMNHSLCVERNKDGTARTPVTVCCVTLKEVLSENGLVSCDLLKLDCERAEFDIMESTPEHVFAGFPRVIGEFHGDGTRFRSLLESKNYVVDHLFRNYFAARQRG